MFCDHVTCFVVTRYVWGSQDISFDHKTIPQAHLGWGKLYDTYKVERTMCGLLPRIEISIVALCQDSDIERSGAYVDQRNF